jgi:hypothetical protein
MQTTGRISQGTLRKEGHLIHQTPFDLLGIELFNLLWLF